MDKIEISGFANGYRIANDSVELAVSTDLGPRVLRFGRLGGPNLLGEFPDANVETDYGVWKPYGGHRLWVAPEAMPLSYAPDNDPVEYFIEGNLAIRLVQAVDKAGLQKELRVSLSPDAPKAEIRHRLINRTGAPIEIAPWAITVFHGGIAIVPLEPFRSHADSFLPSQPLVLWPYTDLSDRRFHLGNGRVGIHCDPSMQDPQKIGLSNRRGWAAYLLDSDLLVKRFPYLDGATYPDFGANNEVFVSGDYLEIESLGPLVRLSPDASVEHTERWELHTGITGENLEAALAGL